MTKTRPTAARSQKFLAWVERFAPRHKVLSACILIGLFIFVFVGLAKYGAYQNKFSDKDYAAIEEAAGQVFSNVGASGIKKYEYCSYEAPEKYSSVRLYCGIEMAAYMPYENDTQAIQVAGTLERDQKTGVNNFRYIYLL